MAEILKSRGMEFDLEQIRPADAAACAELICEVYRNLEEKEWFALDSEEETYSYCNKVLRQGFGYGYKAVDRSDGRMAGVFLVELPGLAEENLGYELGMSEKALSQTAVMDVAAVRSEYRGHDLQARLMQLAEAEAARRGYRYLVCTIHPDNRYSHHNADKLGYRVMMTKSMYGTYLRDILMKDLQEGKGQQKTEEA